LDVKEGEVEDIMEACVNLLQWLEKKEEEQVNIP
jgi:hypothetical protein